MHPDDVALHIDASVDALRAAVGAQSDTSVGKIELNSLELHIHYAVQTHASELAQGGSGLVVGNQLVGPVFNVPILGSAHSEEFVLALDLTDYDSQPPTAELLLTDGTPLPRERWPKDIQRGGIVPDHPDWPHRPFFCRPGTREYHRHPQHEDDPWDRHREGMSLSNFVLSLLHDLTTRFTMR
jgi:hypothetical protein